MHAEAGGQPPAAFLRCRPPCFLRQVSPWLEFAGQARLTVQRALGTPYSTSPTLELQVYILPSSAIDTGSANQTQVLTLQGVDSTV